MSWLTRWTFNLKFGGSMPAVTLPKAPSQGDELNLANSCWPTLKSWLFTHMIRVLSFRGRKAEDPVKQGSVY